jgi:prophage tail gpP-like protein
MKNSRQGFFALLLFISSSSFAQNGKQCFASDIKKNGKQEIISVTLHFDGNLVSAETRIESRSGENVTINTTDKDGKVEGNKLIFKGTSTVTTDATATSKAGKDKSKLREVKTETKDEIWTLTSKELIMNGHTVPMVACSQENHH